MKLDLNIGYNSLKFVLMWFYMNNKQVSGKSSTEVIKVISDVLSLLITVQYYMFKYNQ